jgi:ABC-2 type transport system permease protein
MRRLLALALNSVRIEFSSVGAYMQFLVLPLIFTVVIGLGTRSDGDARFRVAVVDRDRDALAAKLLERLRASEVVRPEVMDEAAALDLLKKQDVSAVVTVPANFSARLSAGTTSDLELQLQSSSVAGAAIREAVRSATAQAIRATIAARISVDEAERRRPFADAAERQRYLEAATTAAASAPAEISVRRAAQSPAATVTGFALSSPGQLVTWVLSTLLVGGMMIVAERRMGTLRRLLTMPARPSTILAGMFLGRFLLGALQMLIMIVFGATVLGVKWGNSPAALAMVGVCFGLAATSLGLFIATIARTEQQASGYAALGVFVLAPLGGAWFPMEITSPIFQHVTQALPTTWAMRGFTGVIVRGVGPEGVLVDCGVLLAFAVGFFVLGVRRFEFK